MFRKVTCAVSLLFATLVAIAQVSISTSEHPIYVNHQYNFSVRLPPNLTLDRTAPPNPDHGFSITLPAHEQLWVDASPTDLTLRRQISRITEGCHTQARRTTQWAGKPAVFLQVNCPATQYNPAYQERITLTVVSAPGRADVCYQLGLRTENGTNSAAATELFGKLVAAFRFSPAADGIQPTSLPR